MSSKQKTVKSVMEHTRTTHSEAPRASAQGIRGKTKRNYAEANPAFHPPQLGLLRRTGALRGMPRYAECNFDKNLNGCYSGSLVQRKRDCSIAGAGASFGLLLQLAMTT